MDAGESNVTHSTRKKPCCCSGAAASLSSSGKDLVKFANKSSSSHGNAFPERPTNEMFVTGIVICFKKSTSRRYLEHLKEYFRKLKEVFIPNILN